LESHSIRLVQFEDRISELKDKYLIKTDRKIVRQKDLRDAKGICKNSGIPSKDQA
jgi:hypothetical protein